MNDVLLVVQDSAVAYPDGSSPDAVMVTDEQVLVVQPDASTELLSTITPEIVVVSQDTVSVLVGNNDLIQAVGATNSEYLLVEQSVAQVIATLAQAPAPPASVTPDNVVTFTNKTIADFSNTVHADQVHSRVKAIEPILKGQPVRYHGYNQGENAVEVALANNTLAPAIGIAEENMLAGSFHTMVTHGTMQKLNTSMYAPGTILYPDNAGNLTSVPPATGYQQPIAFVLRSQQNNGAILISAGYPKQNSDDIRGISPFMVSLLDDATAAEARVTLGIASATSTREWIDYVANWASVPTKLVTITAGDVWQYTYVGGSILYRLVGSNPYIDEFYDTFDGTTLSGLVITRGMSIN